MVLSEDGTRILTGDRDEKIRISHYPHTFDMLSVCLAHTELITCVETFGDRVLSAGADAMVCLWRLEDAKLLDSHTLSDAATTDKPIPEASSEESKAWDYKAAGTAQATATVSGRFRGKNEAAPVAAMALHRASKLLVVAVERSTELRVIRISDDDKLQVVGSVSLPDKFPLGVGFLDKPDDAPVLVVAAPFQEESLLAFSLSTGADGAVTATRLDLSSEEAHIKAIRAIADCAKQDFLSNPQGEEGGTGQQQYVQKRRRHTEPGWKELHGKKA